MPAGNALLPAASQRTMHGLKLSKKCTSTASNGLEYKKGSDTWIAARDKPRVQGLPAASAVASSHHAVPAVAARARQGWSRSVGLLASGLLPHQQPGTQEVIKQQLCAAGVGPQPALEGAQLGQLLPGAGPALLLRRQAGRRTAGGVTFTRQTVRQQSWCASTAGQVSLACRDSAPRQRGQPPAA